MHYGENVANVLKLRDKVLDELTKHIGITPEGSSFDELVNDLCKLLPSTVNLSTVQESIKELLGKELTKTMLFNTAWRLAGNLDKLKANKIVYPWQGQAEKEWVPVQVLQGERVKTWNNDNGYLYKMIILAGSPASIVIWKTWTTKVCSYVARQIGFSAPWKDKPYRDGHELVGMRFLAEIDPVMCRDGRPGFDNVACNSSAERWNKDILKARSHVNPPCPYDFKHFCFQCPVGYDKCKAGTHPTTFVVKYCSICSKDAWYDPAAEICMGCKESTYRSS